MRGLGNISILAAWSQILGWAAGTGFLTGGCQKDYRFSLGNVQTYCLDHVCNSNVWTSLNLNRCLSNRHGILTPEKNGNYEHACENCMISSDRYRFSCDCMDESLESHYSEVNLNDILYNWYGWLSCFDLHETGAEHGYYCKGDGWQPDPAVPDGACAGGCPERAHSDIPVAAATVPDDVEIGAGGPAPTGRSGGSI
ncbi:hypothetical protein F4809DRAFT_613641 [Biscogniauxia mediterranea]|nr:hypothetical protein F4809DRAFT_613641 [Biscogniauxia mediterranea]